MPTRTDYSECGRWAQSGSREIFPSSETIDALGSVIALAIERSITAERLARTEATREGERLRSARLDSVTHELRTLLTAITASITSLLSGTVEALEAKEEMLAVIEEESARLNHLIGQAVETIRRF